MCRVALLWSVVLNPTVQDYADNESFALYYGFVPWRPALDTWLQPGAAGWRDAWKMVGSLTAKGQTCLGVGFATGIDDGPLSQGGRLDRRR
jgi:hypothetical protein